MNRIFAVFNRAPAAGGWIHIVPKGELPNRQAGIVQVLDDDAMDSILENIQQDENRMGDNWPGIYAGREHFIYDAGQDSAALGWFKDFQKRDDGIWANADGLTPAGKEAVTNREYKYTSFVADPSDLQKVAGSKAGLPLYRVMKIETIGFTNMANGKDILTPITNRAETGNFDSAAEFEAAKKENQRHVQANKDAADELAAQRKADAEGEAAEFAVPALEKFYRAVKSVRDSVAKTGHGMDFQTAWTFCKQKFPDLYAAAFHGDDASADAAEDAAAAGQEATAIANRVALMAGKNFSFGWNFIREEMPRLFNRMIPARDRVLNRQADLARRYDTPTAAKVFNRLVKAEAVVNRLPDSAAFKKVAAEHPGLFGLAMGRMLPGEAQRAEPNLGNLLQ